MTTADEFLERWLDCPAAELRFLLEGDGKDLHAMLTRILFSARPASPLRLVRFLHDSDDKIALGALGRLVLDRPACQEREAIQSLIDTLSSVPKHWEKSIDEFVANPSVEAWDKLMQFCPLIVRCQRVKHTLRTLKARGVDPNLLFVLGTKDGLLPEAISWAEDGLVDPETILAQKKKMLSAEMRGTLLCLALPLDPITLGEDLLGQAFREVALDLCELLVKGEVFGGLGGGLRQGLTAFTAELCSLGILELAFGAFQFNILRPE